MPNAARIRNGPSSTLRIRRGCRIDAQISLKKNDEVRMIPFARSTNGSPIALSTVLSRWLPVHQLDEHVVETGMLLADLFDVDVGSAKRLHQDRHGRAGVLDDHLQPVVAVPAYLLDAVDL